MDFESEASTARSKIEEYFSHLIETLEKRQTKLMSELDEILSNYRQQRAKIKELEKLNKQHTKRYSSSTVKEILNGFIDKTKTELFSLKEKTPITVRFEWNQKYAREANELGTLKTDNLDGMINRNTSLTTTGPNTSLTKIGPKPSLTNFGPKPSLTTIGPNTSLSKIGLTTSLPTIGLNTSFTTTTPSRYEDDIVDVGNDFDQPGDDYPYTSSYTFYPDNTVTEPIARPKYNNYTPQDKRSKTKFH